MKSIGYIRFILSKKIRHHVLLLLVFIFSSCDEKAFLREVPLDFYAPENSFITYEDYQAALYFLHSQIRSTLWGGNTPRFYWYGTDLVESFYDLEGTFNYEADWGPLGPRVEEFWKPFYRLIYNANVIIGRSQNGVNKLTENQKALVQAEARFFRAYAHKILANLYGGVPIVLEETSAPKRDYVRATRQEVYEQCAVDLEFAVAHLEDIDDVDESRINRLVASHVLSEVYISLNRWQDAVDEASKVINHPKTALMTERFGNRVNDPEFGGDVYWDLFRQGNQDRFAGNTESLWVIQFQHNIQGGGDGLYLLERFVTPDFTNAGIYQSNGNTSPVLVKPNTYYNGRGQGFCKPSPYFFGMLWEKSGFDRDIRNSEHNIRRDVKVNNPSNEYHGKRVIADNLPIRRVIASDTARYFYPIIAKVTTPGRHPQQFWDPDQTIAGSLLGSAQQTWRKHYQIRLAETYLLRAEAYLGLGNPASAAGDINTLRNRARALVVTPDEINIDTILDERLRELHFEELRLITLARLGLTVSRTKQLNPAVTKTIKDHMNLIAIPFTEINRNVEAPLEQNPGY